ncbi:thialysine N-epsilon-acetyltransferase [Bicyclus anynana]|uniref:Thialysine N-epsilon-acetyltransferase n=1 Tax=Bicyclus anynana TaxID=110368 RepID=A0A6J1N6C9_BICAN|nr:thialysine N-epsilon-acetyltransferase [Bicyclus anynana]XP_052747471.1 thialysine N-epsilon-acetyltransferase [Bicyclus anynana]
MSKKYCDSAVTVRRANRDDMLAVAGMVQELADFEKMPEGPKITAKDLQRDGFDSSPPAFRCLVAEVKKEKETAVAGYALYFPVYSTWEGRSMLLEDLYVRAGERRRGVGHRLFDAVAAEALSEGCCRVDFHVLEWNDARSFYESKGAVDLSASEHWRLYRLAGDALRAAGGRAEQ